MLNSMLAQSRLPDEIVRTTVKVMMQRLPLLSRCARWDGRGLVDDII
jgi:hypothetical protein